MEDRTAHAGALILDLDGVVTDTAVQHEAAWRALLAEAGLPFDAAAYERTRGRDRADSLRELLGAAPIDAATFADMLVRKDAAYRDALGSLGRDDLLPGIPALVADAHRAHLAVAIGSSSRNARRVLDQLGITDVFDAIADGSSGAAKPAPDIFLAAAAMLGIAPARCVVVEDATSGVEAALAAGMRVIGVGPAERVGMAHARVDDTSALDVGLVVAQLALADAAR